jgi:hypothetical protein
MGSRRKAGDSLRLPAPSRRDVLGAAVSAPALTAAKSTCPPATGDLVAQCALWLENDFETDRLARRWSALETLAVAGYDYFRMTDHDRGRLPMASEMAAIEEQMDTLWEERKRRFKAITKLTPQTIHEAASLLVIAARMDVHDAGPTAPLVHQAITFLASAKCACCGEAYVPASLPTA